MVFPQAMSVEPIMYRNVTLSEACRGTVCGRSLIRLIDVQLFSFGNGL